MEVDLDENYFTRKFSGRNKSELRYTVCSTCNLFAVYFRADATRNSHNAFWKEPVEKVRGLGGIVDGRRCY